MVELAFDFLLAHLVGVALVIEEDELAYPVDISLFNSVTDMFLPTGESYLIK